MVLSCINNIEEILSDWHISRDETRSPESDHVSPNQGHSGKGPSENLRIVFDADL